MSSPNPQVQESNRPSQRGSCEACRTRKIRCSGDRPNCSRCIASRRVCSYSRQLPMGRPRVHRRVQTSQRNITSNAPIQECLTDTFELNPTPSSTPEDPPSLSCPPAGQPTLSYPIILPDGQQTSSLSSTEAHVTANNFLNVPASTDLCACLSILYLLLAQLRKRDDPVIEKDLPALRKSITAATEVLYCKQCPLFYFSAVQNGIILGALCLCLAEIYNRIVDTIEVEANRASENSEMKRLAISGLDAASGLAQESTEPDALGQPAFFAEVSVIEWRNIMRKVVKAEIYGVEGRRDACFMTLVRRLEERQRSWHQNDPSPDCPPTYHSVCNVEGRIPTCLMMLEDVRRLISRIEF